MKTSKIPDFPKIEINNYIHQLSNKVSIIIEKDVISKFITNNMIKELSSILCYTERTIKKYIQNKKYPLIFIKELNKISNKNVFTIIEQSEPLFFSKWKKVRLPKFITPKLAYFVGYLQGDGSIESNEKRIDFTDESREQLQNIDEICSELFGIKGIHRAIMTIIGKKPVYRLEIGSLVLNSYLHKVFGINRGIKKNLKIPNIFTKNKEILKWYLIGLFDADGTLPKDPDLCKQLFVDVTFKDKEFIEQIKEQLKLFGIETLDPYCRIAKSPTSNYISKTWELRIRKKEYIIKFLKNVGFTHPDKGQRVKRLLLMRS